MCLETARIGKSPKHIGALHDMLDGPAIVMLIEKITGLLTIFDVDMQPEPILVDDDPGIERRG